MLLKIAPWLENRRPPFASFATVQSFFFFFCLISWLFCSITLGASISLRQQIGMILWVLVKINSNIVWENVIFYISYWDAKCPWESGS